MSFLTLPKINSNSMKKFGLYSMIILCLAVYILSANSQSFDGDTESYIDNLLSSTYPDNEPGITVLIAKDGKVLYKKAFGLADIESNTPLSVDNVFPIGSMTKQFTAVAVLQLVNEGKINLNDDIKKYLPDYNSHNKIITIENLLTHTSGILGFGNAEQKFTSKEDIIDAIQNDELLFEPGSNFRYSNSAFYLLGLIIEKASGLTYQEYVQKNIFDPLQMKHSYFDTDENDIPMLANGNGIRRSKDDRIATFHHWAWPYSAGNILSTTEDLLLWNEGLNGDKIVPQSLLEKAFTSYVLNNGAKTNYGYGWNVIPHEGYTEIEHGGSTNGSFSEGIRIPEKDLYIVALSNNRSKSAINISKEILARLMDNGNKKEITPDRKEITLSVDAIERLVGEYEMQPGFNLKIFIENGNPYIQATGQAKMQLYPESDTKFFVKVVDAQLEFIPDADGTVNKLILTQGQKYECKRVK